MKKIVAACLAVLFAFTYAIPLLGAVALEADSDYPTLKENAVIYTCSFDKENSKIEIDGTVNHDVLVAHNEYRIEIYRLAPDQDFEELIGSPDASPLSDTPIAIKFHVSVEAKRTKERFAKYAIALRSPDGELILAAEPQFAGIEASYEYSAEDKSSFKGIVSTNSSAGGSIGAGTAIIPVYLEQMFSTATTGYVYPIEDFYRYFDKNYIDRLDAQVRTYSANGARVYLQLLLSADDQTSGAEYRLPNVYDEEVLTVVCACSEFLSERYREYQSGQISGMIVGRKVDCLDINDSKNLDLSQYAKAYAFYLLVVARSARLYQSNLDIIVPFSDINTYSSDSASVPLDGNAAPTELLEQILTFLEQTVSLPTPFNLLIESSESPLLAVENEEKDIVFSIREDQERLHTENLSAVTRYVEGLSSRYQAAPQHVMYTWSVSEQSNEKNALACAYIYSYYRLLHERGVSSFSISFSETEESATYAFFELEKLLRLIDTPDGLSTAQPLLSYFEESANKQWLTNALHGNLILRTTYRQTDSSAIEKGWRGSFSYVNFLSGAIGDWFCGNECKEIKSDYGIDEKRALRALMSPSESADYAEILGMFEYPENYIYTPFVLFTLAITDTTETKNTLYEIVVTVGNDQSVFTSEYIVHGNEESKIWLDLGEYNVNNLTNYIKISVRGLSDAQGEYSLWLYDMTGYSEEYSSEELAELVAQERMKLRDQLPESEINEEQKNLQLWLFVILVIVTTLGAGIYMLVRKNVDRNESKKI